MQQQRFREIQQERNEQFGGLRIGGCDDQTYGGAAKGWKCECTHRKGCSKYKCSPPLGTVPKSKGKKKGGFYAPPKKAPVDRPSTNCWVNFVKNSAAQLGVNYAQALSDPRVSAAYRQQYPNNNFGRQCNRQGYLA